MKMNKRKISLSTIRLIFGALVVMSYTANADTYFACSSGYTFQSKNNAARCYKPATYKITRLKPCPSVYIPVVNKKIGHFYKKDYQGKKDMCVGTFKVGPVTNTNALETACPSGYSKQIRSGRDRCRKPMPAKKIPPTKAVNR